MKRFLISHSCISACLTFYLICSVLVHHWTTAYIPWINTVVWIATQCSYLLIAIFIGIHLRQLQPTQNTRTILLSTTIGYLLFQSLSYPLQQTIVLPVHWSSFANPQAFGKLLIATIISLCVVLIQYNLKLKRQWREFFVPVGLLLATLALVSSHKFYSVVGFVFVILSSFFVSENFIPSRLSLVISTTPKLWFYGVLVFASLVTHWFPPLFENILLTYKYLTCFAISILILLLTRTSLFLIFSKWVYEWLRWISNLSITSIKRWLVNFYCSARNSWQNSITPSPIFKGILSTAIHALRIASITTIALLILELPMRGWSVNATWVWGSSSVFFVAIAYSFIFMCYCCLRTFLSWRAAAAVLFVFAAFVSAVSIAKLHYLDMPLIPSDLNLVNQLWDSLIFIIGTTKAFLIFAILALGIALFLSALWYFPKQLLNINLWIGIRGVFAFFLVIWMLQPGKFWLKEHLPSAWESGNSSGVYRKVGFITGFWVRYQQFYIQRPHDFSPNSILDLSKKLDIATNNSFAPYLPGTISKPHIIAIQSEAFWDPGQLNSKLFPQGSPGDLSVICRDQTELYCHSGYVEVPVFGGGTSNSEFEFLTGLSVKLLPPGAVPFVHYVQNPVASLGWRLQQANYQTLGIHPNGGSFWNRDKAYPLLGFQEFMDIEAFGKAEKNQIYVNDIAINHVIHKRIKQAKQPQFIFAVTMANHAPFVDQRYSSLPDEPIDLDQIPTLTTEEQLAIKTYSIGVREARAALKEFIDTYSQKNSPPMIIVFYGDHLPILGTNYSIYHKSGFKSEEMTSQFRELYSTPYLVWSNQPLAKSLTESLPVSLLGQEILEMAGLGKSGLQQVISQLQDSSFLRKPTREQILAGKSFSPLNERHQMAVELYQHANFDALFHQHTPAFFGLVSPTTKKPVADLDVDH
jgi:phosphoglycerol transferase MdoB-like AlkP superfamily enzyme